MKNTNKDRHPVTWLITGGCGFIGTSLIRYIQKERPGENIRILDNLSVGTRSELSRVCQFVETPLSYIGKYPSVETSSSNSGKVELVVADIRDFEACIVACNNVTNVIHLAANTGVGPSVENPRDDMEANIIGTFNMLDASRKTKVNRFVFASSGAPVGEVEPPIHEELAPHPVSPYGAGKLAGEGYCSAYFKSYGLETVALRFGNVYGPGSGHKSSVIAKFIRRALKGETLYIYGDGTQTRDFIFIDDLLEAIVSASVKNSIGGEIFQIASNRETTVQSVVETLLVCLEKFGVTNIRVELAQSRVGDVKRNYSDTSKANERLSWKSRYELAVGLEKTVRWFLAQ